MSACVYALALISSSASLDDAPRLALELAEEGDHIDAAVEFRRLALGSQDPAAQGGYYWTAAYQYMLAGKFDLSAKMLDRAEIASDDISAKSLVLRSEVAAKAKSFDEAEFYLNSIINNTDTSNDLRAFAECRLAAVLVRHGKPGLAGEMLRERTNIGPTKLAAIDSYSRGKDKAPWLGGILGMIPGFGYLYAGEYQNALRSFLINGIFIYAMANTAEEEQWGAFSLASFFEIAFWYSGSIYGGIDASHRYNRNRLTECTNAIDNGVGMDFDIRHVPAISLSFRF